MHYQWLTINVNSFIYIEVNKWMLILFMLIIKVTVGGILKHIIRNATAVKSILKIPDPGKHLDLVATGVTSPHIK